MSDTGNRAGNAVHGLQSHVTEIHQLIDAGDATSLNSARDMLTLLADDMLDLVTALRASKLRSITVDIIHDDDDPFAQEFTQLMNLNTAASELLFRALGLDGIYIIRFAVDPATNQIFYYTTPQHTDKLREFFVEINDIPELRVSHTSFG